MGVEEIRFDTIGKETYGMKNIIYGAGLNGKLLYEKLDGRAVLVEAFFDDDRTRWGNYYCGEKFCLKMS